MQRSELSLPMNARRPLGGALTSAPELPLPRLHRDCALTSALAVGSLAAATSARGRGSPLPHLSQGRMWRSIAAHSSTRPVKWTLTAIVMPSYLVGESPRRCGLVSPRAGVGQVPGDRGARARTKWDEKYLLVRRALAGHDPSLRSCALHAAECPGKSGLSYPSCTRSGRISRVACCMLRMHPATRLCLL